MAQNIPVTLPPAAVAHRRAKINAKVIEIRGIAVGGVDQWCDDNITSITDVKLAIAAILKMMLGRD